jgi:hypothetical protein
MIFFAKIMIKIELIKNTKKHGVPVSKEISNTYKKSIKSKRGLPGNESNE